MQTYLEHDDCGTRTERKTDTHTLSLSLSHTHSHSLSITHTHKHTHSHTHIHTHTLTHGKNKWIFPKKNSIERWWVWLLLISLTVGVWWGSKRFSLWFLNLLLPCFIFNESKLSLKNHILGKIEIFLRLFKDYLVLFGLGNKTF